MTAGTQPARRGASRQLALAVLLWTWFLPALPVWRLAASRDLVLPHLPWLVWVVPGRLWDLSPAVWCAVLVVSTVAAHLVSRSRLLERKAVVRTLWALTAAVGFVHILWGSIVVFAARA